MHHLPAEIEIVVKDLWELRIGLLKGRFETAISEDDVFSSQPQIDTENVDPSSNLDARQGFCGKQMPTLLETLSTCYIAIAILRLPIGLGDLHR